MLVNIKTIPGGKGYERPDFDKMFVLGMMERTLEARKESFTKSLLESIEIHELAPEGWSTLSLSNEALIIDGKKQPKKWLKEYLSLYKEWVGEPLPEGKVIELKN